MPSKLYVGNLPFEMTEEHLYDLFNACGTVIDVHIPLDRNTRRPRGFAFVQMDTTEAAIEAINKLNDAIVMARSIKVSPAIEKISTKEDTPSPIRLYAKKIREGECILCGKTNSLYGFNPDTGVCKNCIHSLFMAARPPKRL